MYVELRSGYEGDGPARVGRVTLSKSGHTLTYAGLQLERVDGVLGNFRDPVTGDEYWVSSVKRHKHRRPGAGRGPLTVDDDVRDEYERLTGERVPGPGPLDDGRARP